MAVTWTASAPHADAVKNSIGGSYGASGSSVFVTLAPRGNRRSVLTKLTASGTYTSPGGDAFSPATVGLREIQAAYIVANASANIKPIVDATASSGTPAFDLSTPTAPKIQYFDDGTETAAGATLTGDAFHVIFQGV